MHAKWPFQVNAYAYFCGRNSTILSSSLGRNHLLDLVVGQGLELGASADEFSTEVDVGNSSLSVEGLEVCLDLGWDVSKGLREEGDCDAYLRCPSGQACVR